jgi:dipeptidyl aminopeptidase/acylaminoacyl peptidase
MKNILHIVTHSSTNPGNYFVQENAPGKKPVQVTKKAISAEFATYPWRETKITSFTARDGGKVYTRVYEPAAGKKNNAAVIFVHGAGYLQNVHYWWSSYYGNICSITCLLIKAIR